MQLNLETLVREFVCDESCVKKNILVGITTDDPAYRRGNEHIVQTLQRSSAVRQLSVIDCSRLISGFSFSLREARKQRRASDYFLVPSGDGPHITYEVVEPNRNSPSKSRYADYPAITSDLHSFFRDDKLPGGLVRKIVERELVSASESIGERLEGLLSTEHFCLLVTLNGRHVPSKTITNAARNFGVPSYFWELGTRPDRLYLCSHPPQDFYSYQKEYSSFSCDDSLLTEARLWVLERSNPSSKSNSYSSRWQRIERRDNHLEQAYDCLLATSSQDEYWSLGDIFPEPNYKNQYEGFHEQLKKEGLEDGFVVLRMHPNTLNKSPGYCLREIRKVRWLCKLHPNIRVVWPQDDENTYLLLQNSKFVLVANSTLGVEAMAMGIRTRHLNPSIFATASTSTLAGKTDSQRDYDCGEAVIVALKDVALQLSHEDNVYQFSAPQELSIFDKILSFQGPLSILRVLLERRNRAFSLVLFGLARHLGVRSQHD